jgi:uncharacterized protein YneF (UPF0154 family)
MDIMIISIALILGMILAPVFWWFSAKKIKAEVKNLMQEIKKASEDNKEKKNA